MALDKLTDGASRRLQEAYDEGTRKLVFVLCLPVVDGVFPALLVTGALATFSDMLAVALTIFAGAGAIAILLSYADSFEEARSMVFKAAIPLLLGVLAVALVAPVYAEMFHVERLKYAAGLALIGIAAQMAGIRFADTLSAPAVIMTGMVLSVKNPGSLVFSLEYIAPALLTALMALTGLYLVCYLTELKVKISYIRKGGAAVLGLIALSMFGYPIPSEMVLSVLAMSFLMALVSKNAEPLPLSFHSISIVLKFLRPSAHGKDGKPA